VCWGGGLSTGLLPANKISVQTTVVPWYLASGIIQQFSMTSSSDSILAD